MEAAVKVPPYSVEAEMSVLGSMILNRKSAGEVQAILKAEDFYLPSHQAIFEACCWILDFTPGTPDIVGVQERLKVDGKYDLAGGQDYLIQVCEFVPSTGNAEHYANIVKEKAQRRRVYEKALELAAATHTDATLDELRGMVEGLTYGGIGISSPLRHVAEKKPQAPKSGAPTGWEKLNQVNRVGGFPNAQVSIIAAYHKTGKTTFMLDSARRALKNGERVCYATFADLNHEDIYGQLVRMECGWDHTPTKSLDLVRIYDDAVKEVEGWDLWIYDASEMTSGNDVETFCAVFKSNHAKRGFDRCYVDYAQELQTSDKTLRTRLDQQIGCASKIRLLAAQTRVPTIVGSQITEGGKEGQDRTKDTRAWEEKAGWVLRLKRSDTDDMVTRVQCAFSRFKGYKKEVWMRFNDERDTLEEI